MFPIFFYLYILSDDERKKTDLIYEQYKNLVWYIVLKKHSNQAIADEVFQEVWLKVMKNLDGFEDIYSMSSRGYIGRIAHSVSSDYEKKEYKHPTEELTDIAEFKAQQIGTVRILEGKEQLSKISQLPENYRKVLEYKMYSTLSDMEIAEELGISYAAFRKRLERARKHYAELTSDFV